MWITNRSNTNRAVQSQEQAIRLKFGICEEVIVLYEKRKKADLICAFVFAYANFWFSHDAGQLQPYYFRKVNKTCLQVKHMSPLHIIIVII